MKKLFYILLFSLPVFFTGCKDEGYVKIDSVCYYGEHCFQGEKLPIWVNVDTDNKENTTYKWTCDGGEFGELPSNISMNQTVWIAPMKMGTYTVTCEVECNGNKDVRSTQIIVDEYFNLDFELASDPHYFSFDYVKYKTMAYDETGTDGTTTTNMWMNVSGNRSGNYGKISTFSETDSQRRPPISFELDVRSDSYGAKVYPTYWSFMIKRPYANGLLVDKYIREIRLEVYLGYTTGTLKPSVTSEEEIKVSNMILWYEEYNARTGVSKWKLLDQKFVPNAYLPNKNTTTNMSMNIDKDNHIHAYCKGAEVLTYDGIQEWFDKNPEVAPELEIEDVVMGIYNTNNNLSVDNWKIELK